jgi:asparagine synthase (glutamine-hydrolysing)
MCGIWACIGKTSVDADTHIRRLSRRGPEGFSVVDVDDNTLAFCRLAINGGPDDGMQPMHSSDISWVCNGEIYNWKELGIPTTSESDCSVLGPLWARLRDTPSAFFRALDGVFAMVLYDATTGITTVARDPYGVRPLFYGYGKDCVYISSEMKGLHTLSGYVRAVNPGSFMQFRRGSSVPFVETRWHVTPWIKNPTYTDESLACAAIRASLTSAIKKRMMSDRPVAALLSGGLDSSLVAALVQREMALPLETFSIGFAGSEDLRHARIVADYIGSKHTEIVVTPDDFFRAIPEVIRDIESYDITTVRASVGNWMVAKAIRELSQAKVVFNGDGSDELFGGYKYFARAPDDETFEAECIRLLENIHAFDVLRSDRCISSHGLEARTPFLDKQFVALAMSLPTSMRRLGAMEKWVLRTAFQDEMLLPYEVLFRRKEAFSDGVSGPGISWFEQIRDRVEPLSANWAMQSYRFPYLCPKTPESFYYRNIFHCYYGLGCQFVIPYMWMPRWSPETTDPSARTIKMDPEDTGNDKDK